EDDGLALPGSITRPDDADAGLPCATVLARPHGDDLRAAPVAPCRPVVPADRAVVAVDIEIDAVAALAIGRYRPAVEIAVAPQKRPAGAAVAQLGAEAVAVVDGVPVHPRQLVVAAVMTIVATGMPPVPGFGGCHAAGDKHDRQP